MLRQLAIQMVIAGIVYWWMSDAVSFLLLFYFLSHIHNSISSHHYAQQIELLTEKITQLERKTKSRVSIPSKGKEREGREGREGGKEREGRGRKMPQRSISPSQNNEENVFGGSPAPELPIRVMDLASSSEKEVYPNWRAPTPILNDWFEGECLLKVKTNPPDEVFEPYFQGKRRTIELQLKGRFKQLPRGPIYMGLEVPGPEMAWSFMTKSFANVILQVLKRLVPESHHSFGTKNETPHIVLPLVSAIDYFIATPEGDKSPDLGVESLPLTNDRVAYAEGREKFRIGPTYTLSFHSMYINVVTWKVTNIPGLRDIPFETFWGDRPLRLVAYDTGNSDPKLPHYTDQKRYYFCFEINKTSGEVVFPEKEWRTLKPHAENKGSSSSPSPSPSPSSPPSSPSFSPPSSFSPRSGPSSPPSSPTVSHPSSLLSSSPSSPSPSSPPSSPPSLHPSPSPFSSRSLSVSVEELEKRKKSRLSQNMKKTYYLKVGKRRVLNGRGLFYRTLGEGEVKQPKPLPPLHLSENLLNTAIEWTSYASAFPSSSSSTRRSSTSFVSFPSQPSQPFTEFIDNTSLLKTVMLGALTNLEKTAFFLNVFHTLLLHGLLIFGAPAASFKKWLEFYDRTSYEIAGHVVTLAEIEHDILRARGSKPKFLGWVVGKWSNSDPRKQLSLTTFDPRINIILNYGSSVCPRTIFKFSPGRGLDKQLNNAVVQNLDFLVKIEQQPFKKPRVSLPKSLYWYQYDFGPSESSILSWISMRCSSSLNFDLLHNDKKGTFENVSVKFRSYPYDFHKRFCKLNLGGEDDDQSPYYSDETQEEYTSEEDRKEDLESSSG